MLGLPELIAGVEVEPLTPRRLEWLRAMGNPFICGGDCPIAAIPDFLWYITKDFKFGDDGKRKAFLAAIIALDVDEARKGIDEYIDRAFLDAPEGRVGVSYYSPTAGLYHSLNTSYPNAGWTLERVLDTPLRVIYQLIKVADEARGCTIQNRRSFEVQGKFLAEVENLTAPTQQELLEKMNEKRKEGYKQLTFSQRSQDGTWALAMRKEPDGR
jgi:hypothetical protein